MAAVLGTLLSRPTNILTFKEIIKEARAFIKVRQKEQEAEYRVETDEEFEGEEEIERMDENDQEDLEDRLSELLDGFAELTEGGRLS